MCQGADGRAELRLALQQLAALIRFAERGAAQWERLLGAERLATCAAHLQAAAELLEQVGDSLPGGDRSPVAAYTVTTVGPAPPGVARTARPTDDSR